MHTAQNSAAVTATRAGGLGVVRRVDAVVVAVVFFVVGIVASLKVGISA